MSVGSWGGKTSYGPFVTVYFPRLHRSRGTEKTPSALGGWSFATPRPHDVLPPHGHRAVKQRYYPMLGFGSFESASRFCSAFDELRQYFRVRRRGEVHVSLAEQRRLFLARWRALISELAAA